MSTVAIGGVAPPSDGDSIAVAHSLRSQQPNADSASRSTGLNSPPDSNNAMKLDGSDDSELSDLDEAIAAQPNIQSSIDPLSQQSTTDSSAAPAPVPTPTTSAAAADAEGEKAAVDEDGDIGDVEPAEWSGTVPVFRPTMHQFKDFKKFMEKVDQYGMKSGIIKVIPPQEWKDSLPTLENLVKPIRVREPIKQDIMGSNGTYRQVNILHQRSYNLPQWRQLCDQSEHQPPARRGERRANADKPKTTPRGRVATSANGTSPTTRKGRRGRQPKRKGRAAEEAADSDGRLMTPESPRPHEDEDNADKAVRSVEEELGIKVEDDEEDPPLPAIPRRMGIARQPSAKTQSTSARRKYIKREGSAKVDEAAFKDWDYRMDISDYTPERCEELERTYWKTLTYAPPLYGADLPGTLFDENCKTWNLNNLPNLLDVLGTKVPGVNTAYLYLGMWKATFAWHLEDVDLYSINYLHFGAPKQWYSISQGDARRFEAAMKNIWPTDAKACDQFLRHKAFLISPSHLQQHYGIRVNKCVSYPGEFVVTYPYGYHSGYNLGYNCAEAVNFALDSWLPMGRIAKKCECAQAQDSVWVDVYEIERKLRGESTEYEETEEEDEDDDEEDDEDEVGSAAPSLVLVKPPSRKRKRQTGDKEGRKVKKIRVRVKTYLEPPCCLCPNDIPGAEILPTDDGRKAHRLCALYLPETFIETENGQEVIVNAGNIDKNRLGLKCVYCRSKRGACFQCSQKKCVRSYHATCAAAAGVFIEEGEVPVFGDDGTEYKEQAYQFSCRFHRTKRNKKLDGNVLEKSKTLQEAASRVRPGETHQFQYFRGDIFAGVVLENRADEHTILIDVLPHGDRIEVEWKWLLVADSADYKLPKASATALPMPTTRRAKELINAKRRPAEVNPQADDPFVEGFTWAEFNVCPPTECRNAEQVKVDLFKANQVWYYLGKSSTDAKARYTEDPAKPIFNPKGDFLHSLPRPPATKPAQRPVQHPVQQSGEPRRSYSAIKPPYVPHTQPQSKDKPYVYKPRKPIDVPTYQQFMAQLPGLPSASPGPSRPASFSPSPLPTNPQFSMSPSAYGYGPQQPSSSRNRSPPIHDSAMPPPPSRMFPPPTPTPNPSSASTSPSPVASVSSQPGPTGTLDQNFKFPTSKQTPIPPPVIPTSSRNVSTTFQTYPFFKQHHNRESTKYRTPYAPWGGFTNGYEGNLRAHLMSTQTAPSQHHRKTSSFGLGGGLMGLTRPSPHTNYQSPPSSSSSASSPYISCHHARFGTRAGSSASSYTSFDTMLTGQRVAPQSPSHNVLGPFAGSPGPQMGGFDMAPPGSAGSMSSMHQATIGPQFGPPTWQAWQQSYQAAMSPFTQGADVNFSPPSPIAAGSLAPSPIFQHQSLPFINTMNPLPPLSSPFMSPSTSVMEDLPEEPPTGKQTPGEQLKQQLRRISDPFLPNAYSAPHLALQKEVVAHASVSAQIPAPMPPPAQAPASKPKQLEPHLHRPATRP